LLYGRFRITPAPNPEWVGYFFDTPVASVRKTTLAIDRRFCVTGDVGRISGDNGPLQLA
jgi:hypothetical protein